MGLLLKIPQDGTYDQLSPIRRLLKTRKGGFYSYDLSSATDRLPILVQE
jgi:hypothetical protein